MNRPMVDQGRWHIAFEGTDGAGKSFHIAQARDWLEGEGVEVRLPTSDRSRPIRALYRRLIADGTQRFPDARTSVLLGLADYADVLAQETAQAASAEKVVLFDRYIYSPMADAIALGVEPDDVLLLASMFPAPDITFILTLDPRIALQRKHSCSVAEAGGPDFVGRHHDVAASFVDYQERVRDAFHLIEGAQLEAHFVVLDASPGPMEIFERIQLELTGLGVLNRPLQRPREGAARV